MRPCRHFDSECPPSLSDWLDRVREAERLGFDVVSMADHIGAVVPGLTAEDVLDTPFILLGTATEIAEQVRRNRNRWGFTYLSTSWHNVPAMAEVMPLLRS